MDKNDCIVERVQFPNKPTVKLLRTAAYARVSSGKDAMLHLYEDDIKKRFIEVCNQIAADKEDFLLSCQQIVEMLSDTARRGFLPKENGRVQCAES